VTLPAVSRIGALADWWRALRPAQWSKNAVVAAAFLFAMGDRSQAIRLTAHELGVVSLAVLAFCLVSSGIYLFNDIRDREADRQHPDKQNRPIAAGRITVPAAGMVAVLLLAAGTGLAWWLAPAFAQVIGAYILLQTVYTLGLKHVALVDILVIATGFVLRAMAGAVVIGVTISPWLLLCAFLLALFLALCKRRHEKVVLADDGGETRAALVRYDAHLLDQLIAICSAATIVCYAIYTLWPDTIRKFGTQALGFTIPFVIFGIFRYLDLVYRHRKGDRPEMILLRDLPLLVDLAAYGGVILWIFLAR